MRGEEAAVALADGEVLSWEELVDEYYGAVYSYARSRGSADPDDVVGQTFLHMVEALPRFEGDRKGLRALIFQIAYRRLADEWRGRKRRPEKLVAEHHPTPDESIQIEETVGRREQVRWIREAMEHLSEREQQVLVERIVREREAAEVGQRLGVSSGNVRIIQLRAVGKIRAYLAERYGERSLGAIGVAAWAKEVWARRTAVRERVREVTEGVGDSWRAAAEGAGHKVAALVVAAAVGGSGIGDGAATGQAAESLSPSGGANRKAAVAVAAEKTRQGGWAAAGETPGATTGEGPAEVRGGIGDVGEFPGEVRSVEVVDPGQGAEEGGVKVEGATGATGEGGAGSGVGSGGGSGVDGVVGDVVEGTLEGVGSVIEEVGEAVGETVEGVGEAVGEVVEDAGAVVETVVRDVVGDVIGDVVGDVVDGVGGDVGGELVEEVAEEVEGVVEEVVSGAGGLLGGLLPAP